LICKSLPDCQQVCYRLGDEGGDCDEAEERGDNLVVARRYAAKMPDFVDKAFDETTFLL
jgi:hypothetical protein